MLKLPNPASLPKDAVVLDLGDLHRQGEAILAQARDRAGQIVAQARAERERLMATAAAEGRAAGHAEGLAEGRAEGRELGRTEALGEQRETLTRLAGAWTGVLERFVEQRERLLADGRREVVRLAAAIASRVVKRFVRLNPDVVVDQVGAAIAMVTRPARLVVAVHPEDRTMVEEALPAIAHAAQSARHVELVNDPALERGSCVARVLDLVGADAGAGRGAAGEAAGGMIDATLRTQLDRMVEALLPGERVELAESAAAPAEAEASAAPPEPGSAPPGEAGDRGAT
ncbi:MAG: FliH/SctL family protein [Phycisphaerales bacterium]